MGCKHKDNNNYDFKKQMFQKRNHLLFKYYKNLFCSISFGGKRILRLSESKEKIFSLPNVSKMPKGNVTKERRRRCILAKNHFIPLNSRGWRPPQTRAAKPRVLNASFKEIFNAHLQSRHAIVTWRILLLCFTKRKHLSARHPDWAGRR